MNYKKKKSREKTLVYVGIMFSAAFMFLVLRLGKLMIIDRKELLSKADERVTVETEILPKRGDILDVNREILASSIESYKVLIDPLTLDKYSKKYDVSKEEIIEDLSVCLELDKDKVEKIVEMKDSEGNYLRGVDLAKDLEKSNIDNLRKIRNEKKYNFLIIKNTTKRYYPNNNFLSHTLGFVSDYGTGQQGVEAEYDDILRGVPGVRISQVDANGSESPFYEVIVTEPVEGNDIVLTIDEKIQLIAEDIAKEAMEETKAKAVSILITNPKNGEILAAVNKPDFNLNEPRKSANTSEDLQRIWNNNILQNAFEIGSTFKIITTAAALEEKVISEDDKFYCKGYTMVNGIRINCWKPEGHGMQDLVGILKNSCNPAFVEISQKLGKEKLNEYIDKFGFGKPTGVDLPGESSGIIKSTDSISSIDLATISFGQTNSLTMIQMMGALNAVMNDGVYNTPHVLKEVTKTYDSGQVVSVQKYEEQNSRQVISKENANTLAGYLEKVVSEGTADKTYIEGLGIAGKTGTAEKIKENGSGYEKGKFISSFVGAAPYDNPEISVMVLIDEPKGEYFGGIVATPIAKKLFENIFKQAESQELQK